MRPCNRFDWERLLRRAQAVSPEAQGTGLILATYADPDGSRVRPGVVRLALVRRRSQATVKRHLRELVDLGLLQLMRRGGGFGEHARANEYRLTMPDALLMDLLKLLDPDEDKCWSEGTWLTGVPSSATQLTDVPSTEPEEVNSAHPWSELSSPVEATQLISEPLPTHNHPRPDHVQDDHIEIRKDRSESQRAREPIASEPERRRIAMTAFGDPETRKLPSGQTWKPLRELSPAAFEGGVDRVLAYVLEHGHLSPDWWRGNRAAHERAWSLVRSEMLRQQVRASPPSASTGEVA